MSGLLPSEADLRDAASLAVDHAASCGADGAAATANAAAGTRIGVRDGVAETAVRDAARSISITVYRNGRSGSASSTALDAGSIRRAAEEAVAIAGLVRSDPDAGLADPALLAVAGPQPELAAPSGLAPSDLLSLALEMEQTARDVPAPTAGTVRVAEAGFGSSDAVMALATSAGFCRSTASSMHGCWLTALAEDAGGAVRDSVHSSDRRFAALDGIGEIARTAVDRVTAQLGARPVSTRQAPILLDAEIASALVADVVAALSGRAQHRRMSFLLDSLGRDVAATHLDLDEDPFEPFGMASGGFDTEGVAGSRRPILQAGAVCGYFLGTASARRLGLRSTGNAGGPWNLRLSSRESGGDAAAMRRRMDTGLVVTRLNGGATDPVSGNWTRAVTGFWVERGEIVHPVTDVTVAGTVGDMLRRIVAVGDDTHRSGAFRTGSLLIESAQIGGKA